MCFLGAAAVLLLLFALCLRTLRTGLQCPDALTEELVQPNENSETIVGRIGIDTYYHGSYEDLLHDQRRSGRQAEDLNIMLKPKLRANYKTGYWEVIFLHTKPLGLVPAEMRARG